MNGEEGKADGGNNAGGGGGGGDGETEEEKIANMIDIYNSIVEGAKSFLFEEYKICAAFIAIFGAVVFVMVSHSGTCTEAQYLETHTRNASGVFPIAGKTTSAWNFRVGGVTTAAFVIGGITSMISGYLGMMVRFVLKTEGWSIGPRTILAGWQRRPPFLLLCPLCSLPEGTFVRGLLNLNQSHSGGLWWVHPLLSPSP